MQGALAFAEDKPVGWCNFGPREDFPRLKRSRVLAYKAAPETWSVNCFFIAAGWRKRGIAERTAASRPRRPRSNAAPACWKPIPRRRKPGQNLVAPFAWTGTRALFEKAGFKPSADNARVWVKRREQAIDEPPLLHPAPAPTFASMRSIVALAPVAAAAAKYSRAAFSSPFSSARSPR